MLEPVVAKCPCGGVTLTLSAPPAVSFFCHCRDCRLVHGGAYTLEAMIPSKAVKIEGETQTFTLKRRRAFFAPDADHG